jgi:4-hydroxy-tetrahydrodipicolinate synthase
MNLKGLGVAMVTPFDSNGDIDFQSIPTIVENISTGRANYIVIMGTTAEVVCLSSQEKKAVIEAVVKANKSKLPLVVGIGGNNTSKVIEEIKETDLTTFGAILSVSPYYNKPSQEGIYHHYSAISKASPIPVIVYNVPSRTGSSVEVDTFMRLTENFDNIIGIKDASGDMLQAQEIIKCCSKDIQLISGDDALTLPMILAGAVGTISVLGNALPVPLVKMIHLIEEGDLKKAYELHYQLLDLINLLFEEGNPVGIKALMECLGICSKQVRLPLVSASAHLKERMEKILEDSIHAL